MSLKTALRRAAPLALAASLAATAAPAQDLTIATSLPYLGFPFFVHMQNELKAEAESLGGIELVTYDGQNQTPKQTADVEAAIVSGVDGLVISPDLLLRDQPYLGESLSYSIPPGINTDPYRYVSIWCDYFPLHYAVGRLRTPPCFSPCVPTE